mmetsp:Transcript_38501/g.98452  ORF Transcript_38501/g.98452 Transcript_38501/m.98452 type:complete len:150 (-) Transcript_38501:230-679(-)
MSKGQVLQALMALAARRVGAPASALLPGWPGQSAATASAGSRGTSSLTETREGYTGEYETVDVEFCVLCDYTPRFELLAQRIEATHPGRFAIRANPLGQPRNGAFEVTWRRPGVARQELWSKLDTGEPSCVEAVEAVAELVNKELAQLR